MRTLKHKPIGNLPTALSSFIGRTHEIENVRKLVSANRLVTLTGAGGSGKTRLALMVAHELIEEYAHGVWLVELASLSDATLIAQAVASVLNVHEQSGLPALDVLTDYLADREILIVLDNCEHLISACAQFVESILQKCQNLKILATSREVLGIIGEVAWTVPPLSLPSQYPWVNTTSSTNALRLYQESESVQLFVARAQATAPGFELTIENGSWVAEICRRLDGIPLAVELAAARVRSLSVQQIAQRLDDRFNLLTSGSRTAPGRQQTLLATLDWSYELLSEMEQKVLQRISIFAGGASLEAAEIVCASTDIDSDDVLDALFRLVDKSLIIADRSRRREKRSTGEEFPRYRLLETIRQYALEKLSNAGDLDAIRNRHLHYFIQWAEVAEPNLYNADQLLWLELYENEHDNLRGALEWCSVTDQDEAGLCLAAACGRFWRLHGYANEGRTHYSAVLSRAGAQSHTITRARALTLMSNLIYLQSDYPAMHPVAEEALSIWRELGDAGRAGAALTLDLLGELATEEGDYELASVYSFESLAIYQELNDPKGIAEIYMQLGWAAMRIGGYAEAKQYLHEFLDLARQIGETTHIAFAFSGLGELAVRQEEYEEAISFLNKGLELNRERGDKWGVGTLLGSLGWAALRQHDFENMRTSLGESLAVRKDIGDKGGIAWCLEKLAEAKYAQSQWADAARIFAAAAALRAPLRSVIDPADQPEYKRLLSDLRSMLGHDAFVVLWVEGKSMKLDDVIDLALSEVESQAESNLSEKEKFGGLTAREREVAVLITEGKSNREIAQEMTVGIKTIETYVTRILNKLGFDSRVQIATWAIEKGLK